MAPQPLQGTSSGLDGVVVADTALSDVDGERGRLVIAGHPVEELAGRRSFEEVCALLLGGAAGELRTGIAAGRLAAFEAMPRLGSALQLPDGMDALRAALAQLAGDSPAHLIGATAVFVAAWLRARAGAPSIPPDGELGHAADYLRMAGCGTGAATVRALEAYLVAVVDHGMNASTFTARVIASTGSDLVSAVVGAVGALKGPLHGGAPGPVLDMLDAIGTPGAAAAWIDAELAAGRRIMGMGHRIYRVRDPRAAVLERVVRGLEESERSGRLKLASAVEAAAAAALRARHPDRPLPANVEFYTAVLLDAVGLPRQAFTPTFAVGRVAGWCAHVLEQRRTGRLIRPASRYIGPAPG